MFCGLSRGPASREKEKPGGGPGLLTKLFAFLNYREFGKCDHDPLRELFGGVGDH